MISVRYVGGPNDNTTVYEEKPQEVKTLTKLEMDYSRFTVESLLVYDFTIVEDNFTGVYRFASRVGDEAIYLWEGWKKDD